MNTKFVAGNEKVIGRCYLQRQIGNDYEDGIISKNINGQIENVYMVYIAKNKWMIKQYPNYLNKY